MFVPLSLLLEAQPGLVVFLVAEGEEVTLGGEESSRGRESHHEANIVQPQVQSRHCPRLPAQPPDLPGSPGEDEAAGLANADVEDGSEAGERSKETGVVSVVTGGVEPEPVPPSLETDPCDLSW